MHRLVKEAIPMPYDRGLNMDYVRVSEGDKEYEVLKSTILKNLGVQSIMRVPSREYPQTHKNGEIVIHFGLPIIDSKIGQRVALARILKNGHFNGTTSEELLPLLSFKRIWLGRVTQFFPSTQYDSLPEGCFENTIGQCSNIKQLQDLILSRYRPVLPGSTDKEILSQGVSIRYIQLSNRVSFPRRVIAR